MNTLTKTYLFTLLLFLSLIFSSSPSLHVNAHGRILEKKHWEKTFMWLTIAHGHMD